jgi:hypothetical protein
LERGNNVVQLIVCLAAPVGGRIAMNIPNELGDIGRVSTPKTPFFRLN